MSFILAPFIASGLGELGLATAIGEGSVAIGASEAVGSAVGASAQGAIAGSISSAIGSSISSVVDSVFGQGTSDFVYNKTKQTINESNQLGQDLYSGNYQDFINNEIKKKLKEKNIDYTIDENGLITHKSLSSSLGPVTTSTIIPPTKPVYENYLDNTRPMSGLEILQPNQNQNTMTTDKQSSQSSQSYQSSQSSQNNDSDKVKQIAKDLASTINTATVDTLSKQSRTTVLNSSSELDNYLSGPLASYLSSIDYKSKLPNNDLFRKIYQTYTGRSQVLQSVYEVPNPSKPELKIFGIYEEDGQPLFYYQEEPKKTTLRPIYPGHVWTGPQSLNNTKPVDIWDLFSFEHDASYQQYGYFDRVGDYKYISRLLHGLEDNRFSPQQIPLIKNTILYFSTIGNLLSLFNANSKDRVGDTFTYNSSQTSDSQTLDFVNYVDPTISMTPENKQIFIDTLKNTLVEQYSNSAPIQQITNNVQLKELQLLESLQITLV